MQSFPTSVCRQLSQRGAYRAFSSSSRASTTLNPLPASFLRGGTSKGVFINAKYLPTSRSEWEPIFLGIMGSPDSEYGRQLNGMGGGVSSLSKIVVLSPPAPGRASQSGVQAEYTFAQIGIRDSQIDYSGNCGNLSSMVGVFAVDEGICQPFVTEGPAGELLGTVRLWNSNTNKVIQTTFPLEGNTKVPLLDLPQVSIAGVSGKASQITLEFVNPAGARTGKLLPTGNPTDTKSIESPGGKTLTCTLSLVDAANPTVFISSESLFGTKELPSESRYSGKDVESEGLLKTIEAIRRAGAELMGLDPTAQAQPKIAILGVPRGLTMSDHTISSDSNLEDEFPVDIDIQAMSMGVLHRAVPMTVGLGLGVAAHIEGTIAHRIVTERRTQIGRAVEASRKQGLVRMKHPSGVVDVGAEFAPGEGGTMEVKSAKVVRTGRRLMRGEVWW